MYVAKLVGSSSTTVRNALLSAFHVCSRYTCISTGRVRLGPQRACGDGRWTLCACCTLSTFVVFPVPHSRMYVRIVFVTPFTLLHRYSTRNR
ncbi:hypothetical protein K491DRAFT_293803 [Lophiostoma macrostomum CBS 122681]|uniref:Uncharacterized protein n=1 Tax=Lophiostoma macrostomum CBS 122681 TaxID=1314788 RepID=A0A6A6TGM4_9PLEO|nr:hypothetical protein K491DRAFT_293803 [Lophiostoma macrostomum CBS 122681]